MSRKACVCPPQPFPLSRDRSPPPVEVKRQRVEDEHEGIVLPPKWMMQNVGQREVLDPTIVDLEATEQDEAARAQGVFYGGHCIDVVKPKVG